LQNDVDSIMSGPYLNSLSQYRNIGHAGRTRSDTITSSSPGSSFTDANVASMLQININNNILPDPNSDSSLLYLVITQPGSSDPTEGLGGEHSTNYASNNRKFHYGWTVDDGSQDGVTVPFSHELVEAVTDPEGSAFTVTPPDPNIKGSFEIGDGQAQNYSYRLTGVLVQAYFSTSDAAYVVNTGQTQKFLVSTVGELSVNGDQLFNKDDTITADDLNGSVQATLNGEVAQFEPGSISAISINAGIGTNTFNLLANRVPVTFLSNGPVTVNAGKAGSVAGIQGNVGIIDLNGVAGVYIDDHNRGGPQTATIDNDPFGDIRLRNLAVGTIFVDTPTYNVAIFSLRTGSGPVTVNVLATGVPMGVSGNGPLTVNVGNAGSLDDISHDLTVTNANGPTQVGVDDSNRSGTRTATLDNYISTDGTLFARLRDLAAGTIYAQATGTLLTVRTGIGPVTANVLSTATPTNVVGFGPLTVNVGNASSLAGIQADLSISEVADNVSANVVIDDRADNTPPAGPITFSNNLPTYSLAITGAAPGGIYFATGQGSILNTSLFMGAGDKTFNVQTAAEGVALALDGGNGTNTLDYTGYTDDVLVDLQVGTATGFSSINNIENVTGASGGGAGYYNLLIGNGNNVLTGGTGRRNILVAGGSASTLNAGDSEDLLIGGATQYDTEPGLPSWQAIAAYWAGTDDYSTRLSNLTTGNGVPLLDATAVTSNGGGNTINGMGALALIYTDGLDGIGGFDPNSQTVAINP
jgi:hypothetical protein